MTTSSSGYDAPVREPAEWIVVRLSALGDLALTTGVLDYWHRTRGWTFTVITREAFAPILEGHPAVRSVVGLRKPDLRLPRQLGTGGNLCRTRPARSAWYVAYASVVPALERSGETLRQAGARTPPFSAQQGPRVPGKTPAVERPAAVRPCRGDDAASALGTVAAHLAFPRRRGAGTPSAGAAPRQRRCRARRPASLRHASR